MADDLVDWALERADKLAGWAREHAKDGPVYMSTHDMLMACADRIEALEAAEAERDQIRAFLVAYATGEALTFADPEPAPPHKWRLLSSTSDVRKFAASVLAAVDKAKAEQNKTPPRQREGQQGG